MRSRSILAVALVLSMGAMMTTAAFSGGKKGEKTVTGEIVDTRCYAKMGARGEDHQECALKCAEMGIPSGILDEKTGKVYTILAPSAHFAKYQAMTARITGKVFDNTQGIAPTNMEVKKGSKWAKVELPKTMM